jgi:hypothetical protein
MEDRKPYIWQMIKEAIEELNGKATNVEIRNYINNKWGDVNPSSISCHITLLTVNQKSRINWPENQKPRLSNSGSKNDMLFSTGRGQVVKYNPEEHGVWEIYKNELGSLSVRQVLNEFIEEDEEVCITEEGSSFLFPLEANLRDFLIQNLDTIKDQKLKLFVDGTGRDGREYPTEVGQIDILAIDENGNFVVFELKLIHGVDKALGQLLKYMGWVKKNLAIDKKVKGIIVANRMDDKIKYAVSIIPEVSLYEYEMKFELTKLKE